MSNQSTAASLIAESRRSSVMKGIKQGAIKGVVDKVVDTMAGPISEAIVKNLKTAAPAMEVLEPAVRVAVSFIFIMGIAELMVFAGPMAGKVMPNLAGDNVEEKSQLLAQWMRQYAGEKIGEQVIDAAVSVFPLVMSYFSEISIDDIKTATIEIPAEVPAVEKVVEHETIKV